MVKLLAFAHIFVIVLGINETFSTINDNRTYKVDKLLMRRFRGLLHTKIVDILPANNLNVIFQLFPYASSRIFKLLKRFHQFIKKIIQILLEEVQPKFKVSLKVDGVNVGMRFD